MPVKPRAVFLDFATMGPQIDTSPLDELLDVRYYASTSTEETAGRLSACRIAFLNKARIGARDLAGCDQLGLIALAATGTDNVDLSAAEAAGIGVSNIRDYCSPAVAQHVFALILTLNQDIVGYDRLVRDGEWSRSPSFALFAHPIRELAGRKLGIVGFGALGRAVARLGESLGMQILVAARPGTAPSPGVEPPRGRVPVDTLLAEADVVSLHCPLTEATRHLLGPEEFRRMQPHALLINTARGGLVDQHALAQALRAGEIAGAGIDVMPSEPPPPDAPLLAGDIPNLLITPHIAWASIESRQRAIAQLAENAASFLEGGDLRRVV